MRFRTDLPISTTDSVCIRIFHICRAEKKSLPVKKCIVKLEIKLAFTAVFLCVRKKTLYANKFECLLCDKETEHRLCSASKFRRNFHIAFKFS